MNCIPSSVHRRGVRQAAALALVFSVIGPATPRGLFFGAGIPGGMSTAFAAEGVDCSIAATAMESASRIRTLSIKQSVPCKLQDQKQVESYLRDVIRRKIPPERIKYEGEAYRLLGIIPYDYQYLDGLIELYTGQLGGYYDPEKEYYAMASWMPAAMQIPIAVHELTHALQDQHFSLEKLIDHENENSDALIARSALIEGDATAVMVNFSRELSGQQSIEHEASVGALMMQNITGAMISGSLQKAPPALQAMLIFPYVSGLNFVHALLKSGGFDEVDKAFNRLPATSEEILHPDQYLSGEKGFRELEDHLPPETALLETTKPVFSDRLGEFVVSILLSAWIPPQQASEAASGWAGDRISLYHLSGTSRVALVWALEWDTEEDADFFYSTLVEAYRNRFSADPVTTVDTASFIDKNVGRVRIRREHEKKVVLSIGG